MFLNIDIWLIIICSFIINLIFTFLHLLTIYMYTGFTCIWMFSMADGHLKSLTNRKDKWKIYVAIMMSFLFFKCISYHPWTWLSCAVYVKFLSTTCIVLYYTLRFCFPYLSLLAQPVTIFVYGPVTILVYGPARYLHYYFR